MSSDSEKKGIRSASGRNAGSTLRVFGSDDTKSSASGKSAKSASNKSYVSSAEKNAKSSSGKKKSSSYKSAKPVPDKQVKAKAKTKKSPAETAAQKAEARKQKVSRQAARRANRAENRKKFGEAIQEHVGALIAVMLILIAAGLCILAYLNTIVEKITVSGNVTYTDVEIINRADVYTGRNILLYDTAKISKQLSGDPYLEVISVKRVFPNEISITVAERHEYAAVLAGTDNYCIIDRSGMILQASRSDPGELIQVMGLSSMGFKAGNSIIEDKSLLQPYVLIELFEAFGERDKDIKAIDLSIPASLKLTTSDGYTVMFGEASNIAEKVQRMFGAIDRARSMSQSTKVIYINDSGSSDFSGPTPAPTAAPTASPTAAEPDETDTEEPTSEP